MRRAVVLVCLLAPALAGAAPDAGDIVGAAPDAGDIVGAAPTTHASDIVGRRIVVDAGQLAAELTLEVNLAHGYKAAPLSLAPDVWWGASPRWTLGLVHSNASVDRFVPGGSFCLRTDVQRAAPGGEPVSLYCDAFYRGSGIDARYLALERGNLAVAPRARMLVRDVEPLKPAVTLGALAKWTRGRTAITIDPYLQLGVANTERGNRAQLFLPVQLAVQPTCRWQLSVDTGWNSELAIIDDGWHVPVAFGVRARATSHIDIATTLGFASMLGAQNTPKQRVLFVSVGWRQ